jgi:hypothetical protein
MRPVKIVFLLAGLATCWLAGCKKGWCFAERSRPALAFTGVPADQIQATPAERAMHFGVPLSPALGRARPGRQLEVRFAQPLDSAQVATFGSGPGHPLVALDERRVAGTTLALALPPLTLDRLEVVVQHHLRPPPLPPAVRVGLPREVR